MSCCPGAASLNNHDPQREAIILLHVPDEYNINDTIQVNYPATRKREYEGTKILITRSY